MHTDMCVDTCTQIGKFTADMGIGHVHRLVCRHVRANSYGHVHRHASRHVRKFTGELPLIRYHFSARQTVECAKKTAFFPLYREFLAPKSGT